MVSKNFKTICLQRFLLTSFHRRSTTTNLTIFVDFCGKTIIFVKQFLNFLMGQLFL